MNYTLNQLNIFLKIAQTGSVTKAADELHLTQPAVSIQLKNFQEQFDIPLTEFVGLKIYITDFANNCKSACVLLFDLSKDSDSTARHRFTIRLLILNKLGFDHCCDRKQIDTHDFVNNF